MAALGEEMVPEGVDGGVGGSEGAQQLQEPGSVTGREVGQRTEHMHKLTLSGRR